MCVGWRFRRIPNIAEEDFVSLTDAEIKAIHHFMYNHCVLEHHGHDFKITTSNGSGIGTAISIKCNYCGEEKDITDYDSW